LRDHLGPARERALLALVGFVATAIITRLTTGYLHVNGAGANGGLIIGGVHIHHYVFGIFLLLATSLSWLMLDGVTPGTRRRWFRLSAMAYGVGAALILDEFALWLYLKDVYWAKEGRQSLEAMVIFAGVLAIAALVWPYGAALRRHVAARRATGTAASTSLGSGGGA
jgi:hypothetical protein